MELEIESYSLKDLAETEGRARQTIKTSPRYIGVRIYSERTTRRCEKWYQIKPYTVRYIRLEDIKKALKGKINIDFTFVNE